MNKIRLNEGSGGRTHDRRPTDDNTDNRSVDKNPFLAAKVTQILTKTSGQSVADVVNEYEKYFSCYETSIGIEIYFYDILQMFVSLQATIDCF